MIILNIKTMKKIATVLLSVSLLLFFSACEKDNLSDTLSDVLYVRYKDAEMPSYIYGNGSNKIFLIILNGGPGGKGIEYRIGGIKDLEEKYAVVYMDQRGSGMSSGNYTTDELTPELMAEDVLALVKVLKYKYGDDIKLFLLGHSWGGTLGTQVLLQDQSPFKGWIEVDGGHNLVDMFDDQIVRFNEVADEQIDADNHVDYWSNLKSTVNNIKNEGYSDENMSKLNDMGHSSEDILTGDGVLADTSRLNINLLNYFYEESFIISGINSLVVNTSLISIWTTLDYTERLKNITIPSMVMWGEYDLVIPCNMGEEAYSHLGSAEKSFVMFHASAHSPMVNEPEKFRDELEKFIDKYGN